MLICILKIFFFSSLIAQNWLVQIHDMPSNLSQSNWNENEKKCHFFFTCGSLAINFSFQIISDRFITIRTDPFVLFDRIYLLQSVFFFSQLFLVIQKTKKSAQKGRRVIHLRHIPFGDIWNALNFTESAGRYQMRTMKMWIIDEYYIRSISKFSLWSRCKCKRAWDRVFLIHVHTQRKLNSTISWVKQLKWSTISAMCDAPLITFDKIKHILPMKSVIHVYHDEVFPDFLINLTYFFYVFILFWFTLKRRRSDKTKHKNNIKY